MQLDARTLYFVMFLTSVVLGVAELLFFMRRREHRGVGWWAAANLLGALGMLLVGLRDVIPALCSIALGNTLAIVALLAAWFGVLAYDGRQLPLRFATGFAVLLFTVLAVPSAVSQNLSARIIVVGLAMAVIEAANAWSVRRIARRDGSIAAAICAALMLLCASVNLVRSLYVAMAGAGTDYMGHNAIHAWAIFLLVPALAGWNMGLMMMSAERIQRALAQAARTDGLTGALNRDGFRERVHAQLTHVVRTRRQAALALIDLDHFKTINDRAGHATGDQVLLLFAQVARQQLREADLLARYGGDEFAVLFDGIDADQAELVAARLCQRFAAAAVGIVPGLRPTLSIGVAAFDPGMSLDTLVTLADIALYRAKSGGRDTVALVRDLQGIDSDEYRTGAAKRAPAPLLFD
ncbi:GGDEF domain-containing protein [Solimonas soli]|uniref:GGDEF domain-containing protein n=1 Tax=Solimonas soli TaxID=413479 RepID=UPI00146FAEF2|nr:GGDEF domain-containing protein [Solimonas soli]